MRAAVLEEYGEPVALPTDWLTRWEITLVGSRGMPPTRYGALLDLLDARDVEVVTAL